MEKRFLTPGEIARATINTAIKKSELSTNVTLALGIIAGMFIGLGGLTNILITQTLGNIDIGVAKFAGAAVFPVGLMLVVMCGGELFTGNNLMTLGVMDKKVNIGKVLRNWVLVYFSNFIGSVVLVMVVYYSSSIGGDAVNKAISIAEAKVSLSAMEIFLRGILCNVLVCLGVWMAAAGQDVVSKIFACWFPVMLFVLCGFEHSVANMFFIPMGMALGAKVAVGQFVYNLIFSTLGNIVGGGIIVPGIYYISYINKKEVVKIESK